MSLIHLLSEYVQDNAKSRISSQRAAFVVEMGTYSCYNRSVNVKSMLRNFEKKHGLVGFVVKLCVLYLYLITQQNLYDKFLLADG